MLRAPLGIRVHDGRNDRRVTPYARNLRFRKSAPGGYASASVTLNLPAGYLDDLGPADRIWITNGRTGRILWEGFTERPSPGWGRGGRALDLTCLGSTVVLDDESRQLIYLDRDLTSWVQYKASAQAPSAAASSGDDPAAAAGATDQGLLCQLNPGQPVGTGGGAQIGYSRIDDADMEIGGIAVRVKSGITDTGYRNDLIWSAGVGTSASAVLTGNGISTTPTGLLERLAGGGVLPAAQTRVALQLRRAGAATNVTSDDLWTWFSGVAVAAARVNRRGVKLDASQMLTATYVRADWIVEDLLGRVLRGCNPDVATVDPTAFRINQLTFPDGATAREVLDALATYEPDYLYEVLESTTYDTAGRRGGWRFNYRAWPTQVRYQLTTADGYEPSPPLVDLCNRVAVYWTDATGTRQCTVVTADSGTYPALSALEAAGRVKDAPAVTLPDGRGSAESALRVGQQVLADRANPPGAGRAVVRRPVRDLYTGAMVAPYELEPGYLVQIRETGERLRLTEVEYVDDDGLAELALGTPAPTEEQMLARLAGVSG